MLTIAKLRRLEEITVREFFHLNLDASLYTSLKQILVY